MNATQYEVSNAQGDALIVVAYDEQDAKKAASEQGLKGKRFKVIEVEITKIGGRFNY